MKTLKRIIDSWGFVTSEDITDLSTYFPNMELVIKWGCSPREKVKASQVAKLIEQKEKLNGDYCREVFIESAQFRKLKDILGIEQSY